MKNKNVLEPQYWRYLLNLWSVVFFLVVIWDFVQNNTIGYFIGPIAAIYVAILAIYSTEKEFERWYEEFSGKHFGEIYIVVWTILLVGIFLLDAYFKRPYEMPTEIVSTYIAVLGILAITKRSKQIYSRKKSKA